MRERRVPRVPFPRRALVTSLAPVALAAWLAGCAVGPNYQTPKPSLDASFVNPGDATRQPGDDIAVFWRGFADPLLSQLVERALAANGDVRIAQGRLQEARANRLGADAELLPSIGVAADAARVRTPEYLAPGASGGQRTNSAFDAGFTANWELDFFGRNRRAAESAAAVVQASEAGVHAAQTAIAAEVARNYLELRGLQQRYAVAQASLVNQRDTLRITGVRFDAGRGTKLDVARAQSLFDQTESTLPVLQAAVDRAAYRLATLTAESPRSVAGRLSTPQLLPMLPVTDLSAMPVGTPEQLLRRRPDLVMAERQLAADTAQIGVATADLFPRISLSGLIGFASNRVADLGDRDSRQFQLGAGLTWPILDFGRVRSRISASEARAQQSLAAYEQTISVALEETEGALSQFTRSAQQAERLASSARNAEEAVRLSRIRFDAGATDLLVLLDAQRQSLAARDALVQAQVGQATALVAIYRALGGGWSGPA